MAPHPLHSSLLTYTTAPLSSLCLHSSSLSYQPHFKTTTGSLLFRVAAAHKVSKRFGRRDIFLDGLSSMCSREISDHNVNGPDNDYSKDVCKMASSDLFFQTRRVFAVTFLHLSSFPWCFSALALGNPDVIIEEVTPPVIPSGPLFPFEKRIATLFEENTYSVVNIFDSTLRPQLNSTGSVEVPQGNGSGVVWDRLGHIVTNYHVEAPENLLKPIKVGISSSLKVGQQCLAIGNPFGFDHSLTVGVISALNREIFSQAGVTIAGGIQTDAAINPGNSGGPLLDSKGNFIGINTAIYTRSGASAGVGFAIPSSTVLRIVPQLIRFGKVVRAGLNLEVAPDIVAKQLNVRNGALVLQVPPNTSAAKAGLQPTARGLAGNIVLGDIIIAVEGKPVKTESDLLKILDDYSVGDQIRLKLQRENNILELPVTLEEERNN